jgi:transposase InsO family protein
MYLMAVMDWYSRYVLSWEISSTLDTGFCLEALDRALQGGTPELFNNDQGVQFTSTECVHRRKRGTYSDQLGWTRKSVRQYFRRAPLENGEV